MAELKPDVPKFSANDEARRRDTLKLITADVHSRYPLTGLWVAESDVQRMLIATGGDGELARTKLCHAVDWRRSTLESWLEKDVAAVREFRLVALGHERRPLIYGCGVHQWRADNLPAHWACCWDKAIAESANPYVQLDILFDCVGFQLHLNLALREYFRLAPSLNSYFAERFHKLIVLDFPPIAAFLWKAICPLLPPKTREKIVFMRRESPSDMEVVFRLCPTDEMRGMLKELLDMNKEAKPATGRAKSHALTNAFLCRQQINSQ